MLFLIIFILFWATSAAILIYHFFCHLLFAIIAFIVAGLITYILGRELIEFFINYPFWDKCQKLIQTFDIKNIEKEDEKHYAIFGPHDLVIQIPTELDSTCKNEQIKIDDKDAIITTIFVPINPIIKVFFYPFFPVSIEFTFTKENYNKLFKEEISNE